jgi:lipopolysaccharide/colanic/teichoic acid biosynthesis glycosyltransferase
MSEDLVGLTLTQAFLKRFLDIIGAAVGLLLTGWIILPAFIAATVDTRTNGFFTQARVGQHGRIFRVIKIRTMRLVKGHNTTVTTDQDLRITPIGRFFRRTKIDELPQLFNVLLGRMSLVGPRPDVLGFADRLQGDDRIILTVRPGITGPATLKYRNEEKLLSQNENPERYNREVIFPDKLNINRAYVENYRFYKDIKYLFRTIIPMKKEIE